MEVKKLVILGGPSCIGKSYLIKKIRRGELPFVCEQLGISSDTPSVEAGALSQGEGYYPRMILHYDFVRQMRGGRIRMLPEAVDVSERVTYVTLVATRRALRHRVRKRLKRHLYGILHGSWPEVRYGARFLPSLPIYFNPRGLDALYQRWYDFIAAHPGERWTLDTSTDQVVISPYPRGAPLE